MTTNSVPWQYEWKRPEWKTPACGNDDDFAIEGIPVSTASAQVSLSEVLEWWEGTVDRDACFLLTTTLYSTGKSSSADVLLLELIQHKRNGPTKRLHYRMLRWPGSTITNDDIFEGVESKPWWDIDKNRKLTGLVAIALCRLPNDGQAASAMDARDVVALMSLGLDAADSPASLSNISETASEKELLQNTSDVDELAELIMACLTTDGRVLLYNPQKILKTSATKDDRKIEDGLAMLLLGNDIHQQLEHTVLPLSQPLAIVSLSVPLKQAEKSIAEKHDNLKAIPEDLAIPTEEIYSEKNTNEKHSLWEGSFWDADVEASSAKFHTVDNSPKLLVPAFQFFAVAGCGTRIRKIKRQKRVPPSASRGSSVSSWETSSQQEETWELGAKTRSNTVDSLDSKEEGWRRESPVEFPLVEDEETKTSALSGERGKTKWVEFKEAGGFVTFISVRHKTESRTVYLPFAPKQLSAIVWGGMHFVIVLGDESLAPTRAPVAAAIRVDSFDVTSVPRGEAPNLSRKDRSQNVVPMMPSADDKEVKQKPMCTIRRFHLIPILLPSKGSTTSEVVTAVAVSSALTDPPAIVLQYSSDPSMSGDLIVTLCSLRVLDLVPSILTHRATGGHRRIGKDADRALAIRTHLQHGHVAHIPHRAEPSTTRHTWCTLGQGWSLMGVDNEVYFICWEGSTASEGAFVSKIHSEEAYESAVDALTTLRLSAPVVSSIVPFRNFNSYSAQHHRFGQGISFDGHQSSNLQLPFTSPYKMPSFVSKWGMLPEKIGVEDIVQDALNSLATDNPTTGLGEQVPSHLRHSLSYRERSVRLVRHCSSWTLLGDTDDNKAHYDSQVPVMVIQLGPLLREHFILSLREIVVDNATASPFNQVLGWLSQSKDYFTAASVALDLLRDVECLRDLVQAKEAKDADNSQANLEGLLDGIIPLYGEREGSGGEPPLPSHTVLTQLADMTVGCLLKGGLSMSSTLEIFVQHNPNYDPGRACLMLVSATVCTLSRDPNIIKSAMGADYEWPADDQVASEDLAWPLRSLFSVGASRNYMAPVLQLLNAAIPDDLRNRCRDGEAGQSNDSLQICTTIVSMIVQSSATALMLDLKETATGRRYWESLDHSTRLNLALIFVGGSFPLLQQAEVRSWSLDEMDMCIESGGSPVPSHDCDVPTEWLRRLCKACLVNAGCDLEYISRGASVQNEAGQGGGQKDDDGTKKHFEMNRSAIEALSPLPGSSGLDFDLFVPALLLLANRNACWYDNASLSTQNMLDAACYLVGRYRRDETAFPFDGATLMKQCAISGNISAGANLIGGKNGLVLQCSAVLIQGAGTSMDDAEDYITNDELAETTLWTKAKHDRNKTASTDRSSFKLTDEHRNVLWLLEEYVLGISTYGDFVTSNARGKVDPVFAARACFRTWLLLSLDQTTQATAWLVDWLRVRLGIEQDQVSPKRLACSALTCALVWPTSDNNVVEVAELEVISDEMLLAHVLDMESRFLVELSQSCCGLVEAVPPSFAHEILRQVEEAEVIF